MGQSWSMQFSAGQKIGSDLWISVSLASKKKEREKERKKERNARLLRWSSTLRTFSPAFVRFPFFFSFLFFFFFFSFFFFCSWGREKSLQQKGKLSAEVAALTLQKKKKKRKESPRYGLYVFIDVLFTQSRIFGSYCRCRNTWWVIHLFSSPLFLSSFFAFATCKEKCTFKSQNVGK